MTELDGSRLLSLITAPWLAQCVRVAVELDLPGQVAQGARTSAELAEATGAAPAPLTRLLRVLAAADVLTGDDEVGYGLTESGALLCRGGARSLAPLVELYGEGYFQRAWEQLGPAVRGDGSAFRLAHAESVFEYLSGRPEAAARYDLGMAAVSSSLRALPERYDLSAATTFVDVGGGEGGLLGALLLAHPTAKGVLVDLPHVVEHAVAGLDAAGVGGRCTVVAGDMFDEVPAGGDVYVLSRVLHNWDDAQCARLLATCARAMSPGGLLLIVERLVPDHGDRLLSLLFDLHMMVMTSGRERAESEYRVLLADAGLEAEPSVSLPLGFSVVPARRR